jgi:2'-phosphotransferase
MRKSCEVVVVIDVDKAMAAGVKFYTSSNKVVLTKGIDDSGFLPASFFKAIVTLKA